MKKHIDIELGRRISQLMAREGIKSAKVLADRINELASQKLVTPTSVRRWLRGEAEPKARRVMFLAKALNVSADIILFDDSENPDKARELTKMVTKIVQNETQKLLRNAKLELKDELSKFLSSKKIPDEDKQSIFRQVRNLLKLYEALDAKPERRGGDLDETAIATDKG